MKKVLIIYKFLPQYRVEFFNKLKIELEKEKVELNLVYGKLKNRDSTKGDEVDIDWAIYKQNKTFKVFGFEFYWQPVLDEIKGADLVIVEQANKLLVNYYLSFRRVFSKSKFAYWGHGINHQIKSTSWRNKFKSLISNSTDWWFAYTEKVKDSLAINGYPENKITVVENAIDTRSLKKFRSEISEKELEEFKAEIGINSKNVGIYCGGIYKEKRIDMLIESLKKIKGDIPDFQFIFLGNGPMASDVKKFEEEANTKERWVFYEGSKFGRDKVKYFLISKVFLLPGLVGLAILDSFALNTPMITTQYPFHSPEIDYLKNGINGFITDDDLDAFTAKTIDVLKDDQLLNDLYKGCEESSDYYTIERMVDNFKKGVLKCLSNS